MAVNFYSSSLKSGHSPIRRSMTSFRRVMNGLMFEVPGVINITTIALSRVVYSTRGLFLLALVQDRHVIVLGSDVATEIQTETLRRLNLYRTKIAYLWHQLPRGV
jgi:hypothetical protein